MPTTLRNYTPSIPTEGPPGGAPLLPADPVNTTAEVSKDQLLNLGEPARKTRNSELLKPVARPVLFGASKAQLQAELRFERKRINAIYRNFQINIHFLHAFLTENSPVWKNREANIELLSNVIDYQIAVTHAAAKKIDQLVKRLKRFA